MSDNELNAAIADELAYVESRQRWERELRELQDKWRAINAEARPDAWKEFEAGRY